MIADAALVLYLRTLEPNSPSHTPTVFTPDISLTGFYLRDKIFGPRHRPHDEAGDVFLWHGEEVRVKEKLRVESQDPSLIAIVAKLSALGHEISKFIASLKVVMGEEDTESDL
jgi:Rogdi leucine zipper containing protein